jgi:hypothetical protein
VSHASKDGGRCGKGSMLVCFANFPFIGGPGAEVTVTLAYFCFFDLQQSADILLERCLHPLTVENQVEPLHTRFVEPIGPGEISRGTALPVAAALGRRDTTELLISKGANPNAPSKAG